MNTRNKFGRSAFLCACQHARTYDQSEVERMEIILNFAKELNIDLTASLETESGESINGFDFLQPSTVSQLREKFPDLVPSLL